MQVARVVEAEQGIVDERFFEGVGGDHQVSLRLSNLLKSQIKVASSFGFSLAFCEDIECRREILSLVEKNRDLDIRLSEGISKTGMAMRRCVTNDCRLLLRLFNRRRLRFPRIVEKMQTLKRVIEEFEECTGQCVEMYEEQRRLVIQTRSEGEQKISRQSTQFKAVSREVKELINQEKSISDQIDRLMQIRRGQEQAKCAANEVVQQAAADMRAIITEQVAQAQEARVKKRWTKALCFVGDVVSICVSGIPLGSALIGSGSGAVDDPDQVPGLRAAQDNLREARTTANDCQAQIDQTNDTLEQLHEGRHQVQLRMLVQKTEKSDIANGIELLEQVTKGIGYVVVYLQKLSKFFKGAKLMIQSKLTQPLEGAQSSLEIMQEDVEEEGEMDEEQFEEDKMEVVQIIKTIRDQMDGASSACLAYVRSQLQLDIYGFLGQSPFGMSQAERKTYRNDIRRLIQVITREVEKPLPIQGSPATPAMDGTETDEQGG